MYLATLRSAPRPVVAKLRSIAPRGFTSTATRRRPTRSWKSSAVRLSLAVGTLYYFTTSPVFAEAACIPRGQGQQGAFNPETGEFNWDCSCLGGMTHSPFGEEFRSAFSYFMPSTHESKGMNCIDQLEVMQECLNKYPNVYGAKLADDAEDNPPPGVGDEQPGTSSFAMKAQSTTPIEAGAISEEPKRAHKNKGSKKKEHVERIQTHDATADPRPFPSPYHLQYPRSGLRSLPASVLRHLKVALIDTELGGALAPSQA
ncbi:hypothetical protein LCI18_012759 [Fusarium solani-melongenae]|uniref:Uncharacterized protein n=1 Tax=Fusarium solani subsp. cucurbitae TaxID=2747967 RepID=A0ACD3ZKM0_FUSSC|nr:hypothetical protein LCI18_012759 [Fusarium solani-melongenae]